MSAQNNDGGWDTFSDAEITKVKQLSEAKAQRLIIQTLLTLPIVLFITPLMPGKRGREPLISRMKYWDAILYILPTCCLIFGGVILWMYWKQSADVKKLRIHLQKKSTVASVESMGAQFLIPGLYRIKLDHPALDKAYLFKEEKNNLVPGQRYEITYEVHTKSILSIIPIERI